MLNLFPDWPVGDSSSSFSPLLIESPLVFEQCSFPPLYKCSRYILCYVFFLKERMFSFWCVNRRRAPQEGRCKYHHFSSGALSAYITLFINIPQGVDPRICPQVGHQKDVCLWGGGGDGGLGRRAFRVSGWAGVGSRVQAQGGVGPALPIISLRGGAAGWSSVACPSFP